MGLVGWLPRRGERLLPALSGGLLSLSYPPLHPLVLPFVGLVPFAVWVHDLPTGHTGRAAAVRGGIVLGVLYFGLVFHWLLPALAGFTRLALPVFLFALAIGVTLTAAFGGLLHVATKGLAVPVWIALPVTWTGMEWARAHLPSTLAFPWLGLGTSLTGFPELVGIAELVGARGVTFWIVTVNALAAGVALRFRAVGSRPAPAIGVLTAVVALPMAWGVWRAGTLDARSVGRVALVQTSVEAGVRHRGTAGLDSTLAALDRLSTDIAPGSVVLVALPEMTLLAAPGDPDAEAGLERVQALARQVGAPVLFGAYGRGADGGSPAVYNSAFLMEPGGLSDFRYDKRRLVPVVERTPFLPRRSFGAVDHAGTLAAGTGWPLAEIDETLVGVAICYEATYPGLARRLRAEGADVLVNVSNDSWYGSEGRTVATWQHPAHLVMRAIENRTGVARVANGGISLFVDPTGRIRDATSPFVEAVRTAELVTTDLVTTYTRFGDVVGSGCALVCLLLFVAWGRTSTRSLDPLGGLV